MANTFKNSFQQGVGQTATTIYTAGSGVQATVIGLTIANITSNDVRANVFVNSSGTDYFIVKNATIEPGSALVPVGGDQKLVLESSDFLRVQSDTSSSLDVVLSVLEIT
jgi:hypothetical protein